MIIKSVKYLLGEGDKKVAVNVRTQDDEYIGVPISTNNKDYQEVLKWVADGNTIEEAD
jgi:hypothetical protein|tara:strand:- start:33 stop:206 length:174 start_codon:yes stop_codon:yes gene_type:complete